MTRDGKFSRVAALVSMLCIVFITGCFVPSSTAGPPDGAPNAVYWNRYTSPAPLFSATSPWNTPAVGPADPLSNKMIEDLAKTTQRIKFSLSAPEYGLSVYYADSSTKRVQVIPSTDWWDGMQTPMPESIQFGKSTDRHLVIWDIESNVLYEFWHLEPRSNGQWQAGYGITFDAYGSGHQTEPGSNSARAAGVSVAAGIIRYHEIVNGFIPHALAFAYPTTRGDKYAFGMVDGGVMAIATHNDNDRSPNRLSDVNIPEGARMRLKSSVNLDARCDGNRTCLIIGQALKTYGAYVIDTSPVPEFGAEYLIGKQVSWDGVLTNRDVEGFLAEDFEILKLPPLTSYP